MEQVMICVRCAESNIHAGELKYMPTRPDQTRWHHYDYSEDYNNHDDYEDYDDFGDYDDYGGYNDWDD